MHVKIYSINSEFCKTNTMYCGNGFWYTVLNQPFLTGRACILKYFSVCKSWSCMNYRVLKPLIKNIKNLKSNPQNLDVWLYITTYSFYSDQGSVCLFTQPYFCFSVNFLCSQYHYYKDFSDANMLCTVQYTKLQSSSSNSFNSMGIGMTCNGKYEDGVYLDLLVVGWKSEAT